ncbi:SPOSA6832_00367, partial [Sporobolomyces salmonicolor]
MGMAYASISDIQPRSQSQATSKPFGLRIAKTADGTSELFLGGPNPNMYSGRIEWHPVQKQAYYNITGQVYLGGNAVFNDPRSTIIDSGTTLIIAPPGDADAFWAQVPGATKWDQSDGYYIYPCAKTPQVSFNFDGGKKWTVRAVDMNLGKTSSHSQKCVGAIAGVDVGLGPSTWILGCSFLKASPLVLGFRPPHVDLSMFLSSAERLHRVRPGGHQLGRLRCSSLSARPPLAALL